MSRTSQHAITATKKAQQSILSLFEREKKYIEEHYDVFGMETGAYPPEVVDEDAYPDYDEESIAEAITNVMQERRNLRRNNVSP